jgi:CDP-paratose 2-epimerase
MRKNALVTGAGGLIGYETVRFLHNKGFNILGVDNNLRKYFFGDRGDTTRNIENLTKTCNYFSNYSFDLRDRQKVLDFMQAKGSFDLIVHTAAQPSHDWAAKEPFTDFDVNAMATLNLLEGFRQYSPEGVFIFTSTNKVYGDNPNKIPLKELTMRWEYDLEAGFKYPELKEGVSEKGINENLSMDNCVHSIFGASKVAADIMCQEYGRYFGLNVGIFRGGCLTGPQHSAVELHGFLTYIINCAIDGTHYKIFGYGGKQVRDQIHSWDVANAFWNFYQNPKKGVAYNLGGGKENSASIIEIIDKLEDNHGLDLQYSYVDENRVGDHICYYTDLTKFQTDYPDWRITIGLDEIIEEIYINN